MGSCYGNPGTILRVASRAITEYPPRSSTPHLSDPVGSHFQLSEGSSCCVIGEAGLLSEQNVSSEREPQGSFSSVDSGSSLTKDSFYCLWPRASHILEQLSAKQTAFRKHRFVFSFKKKIEDELW